MYRLLPVLIAVLLAVICGCGPKVGGDSLNQALTLAGSGKEKDLKKALNVIQASRKAGIESTKELFEFEAICLSRLGEHRQALEVCREGLDSYDSSFILNYVMGSVHYRIANYSEAVPRLHKAVDLKPDDANANLLLALAARHDNHPRAGEYFRRLTTMNQFKQNSAVYNEWAMWHLNQGNATEAQNVLLQAHSFADTSPVIFRNVAVIYDQYLRVPAPARIAHYKRFLSKLPADAETGLRAEVQRRIDTLSGN